MKPHLAVPLAVLVGVAQLRQSEYRFAFGLLATLTALAIVAVLFRPSIFAEYLNALRAAPPTFMTNASIPSVASAMFPAHAGLIRYAPVAILCAMGAILALLRPSTDPAKRAVLFLPLSLACSPFAWGHDYLLCVPFNYACAQFYITSERPSARSRLLLVVMLFNATISFALAYLFFVPGWAYVCIGVLYLCAAYLFARLSKE
jgi:hypothetical protein